MKGLCHAILMFALISCADTKTNITGYVAGKPLGSVETHQFLYGKMNFAAAPFGITYMGNLVIGFKQLAQMFTAMVAAYVAGDVAKAQEITKQLASKGATDAQIAQFKSAAFVEAKKIDANVKEFGKAVDGGAVTSVGAVTPVTP